MVLGVCIFVSTVASLCDLDCVLCVVCFISFQVSVLQVSRFIIRLKGRVEIEG